MQFTPMNSDTTAQAESQKTKSEHYRIYKYLLLAANAGFMLPHVLRNFSWIGLGSFVLASALLFLILWKSTDRYAASAYIPYALLFDVLVYIGIQHRTLIDSFSLDVFYMARIGQYSLIFTLAGIILAIIGIVKKRTLLCGIGFTAILESLVYFLYGGYLSFMYGLQASMEIVSCIIMIAGIIWTVLTAFVAAVAPAKRKTAVWLWVCTNVIILLFVLFEPNYIAGSAEEWETAIIGISEGVLSYWRSILNVVVLLSGAVTICILDGNKDRPIPIDAFALILTAESVFAIRFLLSFYVGYKWVLFLRLIAGTLISIKNERTGKKTFMLSAVRYLPCQLVAFVLLTLMLHFGLWINAVLFVLFTVYIIVEAKATKLNEKRRIALMTLLFISLESAAAVWSIKYSLSAIVIIAFSLIVGIIAVMTISLGKIPKKSALTAVILALCILYTAVCFLPLIKNGAEIKFKNENDNTVTIEVSANGQDNEISEITYYRYDKVGRRLGDATEVFESTFSLQIDSEVLVVVAVDKYGIRTRKIMFYPEWLTDAE